MPVSSIAGTRPLIDTSCLPNTNRRRRAWNRFIYLSRSCLSIVIVSEDIFSHLQKSLRLQNSRGSWESLSNSNILKKKSAIFFSRDRSQCVTCDHSQESAVNVILLQNFSENSLIIIAFLYSANSID